MVYEYVKFGGCMWVYIFMLGQIGVVLDVVQYQYDGIMVLVYDIGFKFYWCEFCLNNLDVFDIIFDVQFELINEVCCQYVDYIYNGYCDVEGNYIKFDDKIWKGLKNDECVVMVDLGVFGLNIDFISVFVIVEQICNVVIKLCDMFKLINNQYVEQIWYVLSVIIFNFECYFSDNYQFDIIL